MITTCYKENDANNAASLSRHFHAKENDVKNDVENDTFKDRLKKAIGKEPRRAFAFRAGISPSAVRQYLSGKSVPTLDKLISVTKAANVNLLWLATGEGPKHSDRCEVKEYAHEYQEKSKHLTIAQYLEHIHSAVHVVEMMEKDADADRKAEAIGKVVELLAETDGRAPIVEIMRTIRSAL